MDALTLTHVNKTYATGTVALADVSLSIPAGGFYALLGTPQKADYMQRSEYKEAQFNQLLAQVKSLPNHFNRCSNVNTIKREAEIALNAYKVFAINYNDAVNVYKINPKDYYAKKDMVKLCKIAKESNYNFYITQLNQLNVCQ